MNRRWYLRRAVSRLLLLITALWCVGLAGAQQQPSIQPGPHGQTIVTDAAGQVRVRNPKITHAQRKEVAKRMQAAEMKAAKKGNLTS